MPQFLRTLSDLLESSRATITQDELSALTDDVRDAMLSLKILVPSRTATHVVCDACHEDHVEEVVRIKAGNDVAFRIRCPDSGWVDVPADRLRQWTMDTSRMVSLLSAGIGPADAAEAVIPDQVWRLGSVEIAGVVLSIVLVRGGGIKSLGTVAAKLPPQRTVVVRTADAPDMVDGYAATLALTSAFALDSGQFEFQINRVRALLVIESAVVGNVFHRRGEFWQMSFEGDTKYFKDSVGIGYISRLLIQPHRIISSVMLLAARAGIDSLVAAGTSGEILDEEARRQYGQRYNDLQEDLEKARHNSDLGWQEKIENELEALMVQLAAAVDIRGRSREQSDAERVRRSVSEAVRRDIERITKEHPALGHHLTNSIVSGTDFRYAPERQTDWLT
ncbi:MAG: hypothetical protein KDA58_15740 [Planctomycetaceae bacterium]|nr:hypothetical protein [Planctomycetaceae bacterium]